MHDAPAPPEITGYQVILAIEDHEDPHGFSRPVYDVHVPSTGGGLSCRVVAATPCPRPWRRCLPPLRGEHSACRCLVVMSGWCLVGWVIRLVLRDGAMMSRMRLLEVPEPPPHPPNR